MRISVKLWGIAALSAGILTAGGFEIDSSWQIVCPADAVPTERKAAEDTALYIKKATGKPDLNRI